MSPFSSFVQNERIAEPVTENGNILPEIKTIPSENGNLSEPQDKDVVSEGFGAVGVYDQWVSPPISGPRPKSRYEVVFVLQSLLSILILIFLISLPQILLLLPQHGAAVIDDKMYIFGGNHNGRYLSDLQVGELYAQGGL